MNADEHKRFDDVPAPSEPGTHISQVFVRASLPETADGEGPSVEISFTEGAANEVDVFSVYDDAGFETGPPVPDEGTAGPDEDSSIEFLTTEAFWASKRRSLDDLRRRHEAAAFRVGSTLDELLLRSRGLEERQLPAWIQRFRAAWRRLFMAASPWRAWRGIVPVGLREPGSDPGYVWRAEEFTKSLVSWPPMDQEAATEARWPALLLWCLIEAERALHHHEARIARREGRAPSGPPVLVERLCDDGSPIRLRITDDGMALVECPCDDGSPIRLRITDEGIALVDRLRRMDPGAVAAKLAAGRRVDFSALP